MALGTGGFYLTAALTYVLGATSGTVVTPPPVDPPPGATMRTYAAQQIDANGTFLFSYNGATGEGGNPGWANYETSRFSFNCLDSYVEYTPTESFTQCFIDAPRLGSGVVAQLFVNDVLQGEVNLYSADTLPAGQVIASSVLPLGMHKIRFQIKPGAYNRGAGLINLPIAAIRTTNG